MSERVRYKFVFRARGEAPRMVRHEVRPGDAEACARKLARLVAKKYHWEEAVCVWMGPEGTGIPAEVLAEMAQDGTC